MLNVQDLYVNYGMIQAVQVVSFEVNKGEIVALIGANGAGKTSILQTVTGIIQAKSGSVSFENNDITRKPAHKIVAMGMAHVPEGRRVFSQLTVLENLKLGAYTRKDSKIFMKDSQGWRKESLSLPEHYQEESSKCLLWVEL